MSYRSFPDKFDLGVGSFADSLDRELLARARPVREFGKWLGLLVDLRKADGPGYPAGQLDQMNRTARRSRIRCVVGDHAVLQHRGKPPFLPHRQSGFAVVHAKMR